MMRFRNFLAIFMLATTAQVQANLFDCPEGTICTQYSDGCNSCSAPDGDTTVAACTEMYCPCYEDNTCVPQCLDNPQCVPAKVLCDAEDSDFTLCPIADCASPPEGCSFRDGDYVLDIEGNCCQEQCVLVNATDGGQCNVNGNAGQECIPTGEEFCPIAGCAAPPEGCSYTDGDYFLDSDGNCCPEQCVLVNDVDGGPCNVNVNAGQECTPTGEEFCPIADCAAPPEGCQYIFDHFVLGETGDCCASQCYAVDSNGNQCAFQDQGATGGGQDGSVGDEIECIPSGDESCPVARCAAPPEGCEYIFDHFVLDESGVCCASLCYAVDSNGNHCSFDENKEGDEATGSEAQCTPTGNENCPVAKCAEAPDGCEYIFDHYVINSSGDCCPSLCYAVDSNGMECSIQEEQVPESECAPTGVEQCPVAKCAEPPKGCEYIFDHYALNDMGDCCPSLCYAVDPNGNECSFNGPGIDVTTTNESPSSDLQVGDKCTPVDDQAVATSRQATNEDSLCPEFAGCREGFETGYVITTSGACCASTCHAVESAAVSKVEDEESTTASGGRMAHAIWSVLSWAAMVTVYFG